MDDIDRLGTLFEEDRITVPVAVKAEPLPEPGLLDDYETPVKARNVVWYIIVMLVATLLWSYIWTPLLNYVSLWNDPPEGVDGYAVVAQMALAYTGICLLLTFCASAAACAHQFRAGFSNAVLLLAVAATTFIAVMEMSTGKALTDLLGFFGFLS